MEVRTPTLKQLAAIKAGAYGPQTKLIHRLAEALEQELARSGEHIDNARRYAERLHEYTSLRPEHERALILITKPLGEKGLPAIEVYADPRVKAAIAFECDKLPKWCEPLIDSCHYPEIQVLPQWIYGP